MLCACSGELFTLEEASHPPDSLATRDFCMSGFSSRNIGEWRSNVDDIHVDEAESTLKEALSLNYDEARALLGRLEYQKGNYDAALHVFQGIDITGLTPKLVAAIEERIRQNAKPRPKCDAASSSIMSIHSASLLLEAAFLKVKSMESLGCYKEAAEQCGAILGIFESASPNGMPVRIVEICRLEEICHRALELSPILWTKAGLLNEAVTAYRTVLVKQWNLDLQSLCRVQKELACMLLYGVLEARTPPLQQKWGKSTPKSNMEEAILLLLILLNKMAEGKIRWDEETMDHLTFALSITGQFELLAERLEELLPGVYSRVERWYLLALCYAAADQKEAALNLLKSIAYFSESNGRSLLRSCLLGAKLCSQYPDDAKEGIRFALISTRLAVRDDPSLKGQAYRYLGLCYGNAAKISSVSDAERTHLQEKSLGSLSHAVLCYSEKDPAVIYNIGCENARQRNLGAALESAVIYIEMAASESMDGWILLALVVSAEQRFREAETIVELLLEEAGWSDLLGLVRLKALLQIAQKHAEQAIETYMFLLSLIKEHKDLKDQNSIPLSEEIGRRNMELAVWQDLAAVYVKLSLWEDAEVCIEKANSMCVFSPRGWHITGIWFSSRALYEDALVSLFFSLSIEPDYVSEHDRRRRSIYEARPAPVPNCKKLFDERVEARAYEPHCLVQPRLDFKTGGLAASRRPLFSGGV